MIYDVHYVLRNITAHASFVYAIRLGQKMSIEDDHTETKTTDEILVSTRMVEECMRNDFWQEASRPFYETTPLIADGTRQLEGTIKSREVAGLTFASVAFNDQRYKRDRRIIAWSGLDQYLIAVVIRGTVSGDFAGTDVVAHSGDICVLDLTKTLHSEVTAGCTLSILIPRAILAKATGYTNLHGFVLKSHMPMTRLITTYLEAMNGLKQHLDEDEAGAAQEATVTLIATALLGERTDSDRNLHPLTLVLRQRALGFINQHINNPHLSPELVLRRFNVSRTHLYRAFAGDGGIKTLIQARRLDAAFLELTRKEAPPRSIAAIAAAHGYSSTEHFSNCFKSRFDLRPSEARSERQSGQLTDELQSHLLRFARREEQEKKP
ncbi:AraC-like DNA-binding protein [Ochrobactrum sp. BH3]|nr:AraC-like DNA-binding protein [Ochrobactrum sp. BH3]